MSETVVFFHFLATMFATFTISMAAGLVAQRVQRLALGPIPVPAIEPARHHDAAAPGRRLARPYRLASRRVANVNFSRAARQRRRQLIINR